MPIPAIEQVRTGRLCIRPVRGTDLADLLAVNGDAAVTEHLPYATWQSLEDAQAWFVRMQTLAASGTAQQLVVERVGEARVIGSVLLFQFDEASARLELGYVLGRAHWRLGLAREALQAVCSHLFGARGVRRIEAEVNPANLASNALLRALGFVHEGLLRKRWVAKGMAYDTNLYACLADEWKAVPGASL